MDVTQLLASAEACLCVKHRGSLQNHGSTVHSYGMHSTGRPHVCAADPASAPWPCLLLCRMA
jgi:hypothetical protein